MWMSVPVAPVRMEVYVSIMPMLSLVPAMHHGLDQHVNLVSKHSKAGTKCLWGIFAYRRILCYDHHFLLAGRVPIVCTSCRQNHEIGPMSCHPCFYAVAHVAIFHALRKLNLKIILNLWNFTTHHAHENVSLIMQNWPFLETILRTVNTIHTMVFYNLKKCNNLKKEKKVVNVLPPCFYFLNSVM